MKEMRKGLLVLIAIFLVTGGAVSANLVRNWTGKDALDKAESVVEKLKDDVKALDIEVDRLNNVIESLEIEKTALINERDNLLAQADIDAETIQELNDQITELDELIAISDSKVTELLNDVARLETELATSQTEVDRLNDELAKANQDATDMLNNICTKVDELPLKYSNNFNEECSIDRVVVTNGAELADALAYGYPVIHLANGIYEVSTLNIDGDFKLIGESKDGVVIKPLANTEKMLHIHNGNVEISNLTIDGAGFAVMDGIYNEGNLVVNNIVVKNIFKSTYYGFGIRSYGTLQVSNSKFENIERVAVHINKTTGNLVENSIFIGSGSTGNGVQYGVEVERGGAADIKHNTFTGFGETASSDGSQSGAILATTYFDAPTTTTIEVKYNTINDSTYGILIGYSADDYTKYEVANNTFNNVVTEFYSTQQ